MCASHYQLERLVAIVDRNRLSCDGEIACIQNQEPYALRWESFGWSVREVDGHNADEVAKALHRTPFQPGKPSLLIAHTVKGRGVSFMENKPNYHRANISPEQVQQALAEIAAQREALS
jgi:transketolase